MICTKTYAEAEPIVDSWISQAIDIIETFTGTRPDFDSISYELADCEWIIYGGEDEAGNELLDMEATLRQLSYIVERTIDNIRADQEES